MKTAIKNLEVKAKSIRSRLYHLPGGHDQEKHGNDNKGKKEEAANIGLGLNKALQERVVWENEWDLE